VFDRSAGQYPFGRVNAERRMLTGSFAEQLQGRTSSSARFDGLLSARPASERPGRGVARCVSGEEVMSCEILLIF
jgi:hypothetical protein